MTSQKDKAEAYVRAQCPELMKPSAGCRLICKGDAWHEHGIMIRGDKLSNITTGKIEERDDSWEIIGHPIQLQHWLRVLPENRIYTKDGQVYFYGGGGRDLYFNLTTGQPATEADYAAFNQIVGA